jgi:Meiotically Up-regulated Gene 113 (MUG113) protein
MPSRTFTEDDDALLGALGVEVQVRAVNTYTPKQERIIAGFEEIQSFVDEHGHLPQHGEDQDIFERLYAVRLDRLRLLEECRELLSPMDRQGLLSLPQKDGAGPQEILDDAELLEELGVKDVAADITQLQHVRSSTEKRAAEEIANREKCVDFEKFEPLFERVQQELESGVRETRPFKDDASISKGDWFILSGQKTYVADAGEEFVSDYGRPDQRLRVIFDNQTESNMLKRSLERALQKDEAGRRITDRTAGPLFSDQAEEEDLASGLIYVLRSMSNHPLVAENRKILHKIGVTGNDVEQRIANAKYDPTFLMADVEIVATYELYNINRIKLENLIHRFFETTRLDVEIKDRFGKPVKPREWFLVPISAIDEAVKKIEENKITKYRYDVSSASIVKI